MELPVRFHLVRSSLSELNATLTAAEVPGLVAEVQSYWDQACIRIQIESVIQNDVSPEQEQAYTQAWQGDVQGPQMKQLMTDVMPKGNRLSPGWNVMIFRQFNKFASGVYLSEIGSVLWAEALPPPAGSGPNPPVILAHEVGHALGLLHYEGAGLKENLMCEDVMQNQTTAAGLTPEQIGIARAQALTGKTFVP